MEDVERMASSIRKFQKVAIYPLSVKYGDDVSSFAEYCISPESPGRGSQFEVEEPFEATFLNYDGNFLYLSTEAHSCIRIAVAYVKQIFLIYG
ncbi:hypothetical protein ApAK_04405 [Thermoplasmatales archaeon AK]|nr:hypothetical protein [Thermoplasmatales archaeon AK]